MAISYRGLKRSLIDFKRHPWLHFVSLATITLALLIVGVFFLGYRNLENMADKAKAHSTGTAYLKETLPDIQLAALKERILALPGVRKITFKTRDSVMDELQTFLGSQAGEHMAAAEIFPDVLEVEVKKNASVQEVTDLKAMISQMPEISDVDFSEDWMLQFQKLRRFFDMFGLILTGAAIVGCGFIIANFMGMRHQSRRSEIDIVRLHGAHRNFVMSPFLWEGAIEGISGSLIALAFVYLLKVLLGAFLTVQWASLLGIRELLYLSAGQTLAILGIGIAMAFFGSITVFLRFQENSFR
jgi:cell division transport system permease protein